MNKLTIGGIAFMATMATMAGGAETAKKTVRLVYPQWQGASIAQWIPEVKNPDDAARGYYLGAELLNFLAPKNPSHKTLTVPVSLEVGDRKPQDGVIDRDTIAAQTRAAVAMLKAENPDRIITLGGECSVSVPPFTYLAGKYGGDVAVLWIDAHPDITLPGDVYPAYHAMAVTALMGKGDGKILAELPATIPPERILFVGLRDWEREQIVQRQKDYGMKHLGVADVRDTSQGILDWIKATGAKHILIHFDLDVLDPAEIIPAVGVCKDGLKMAEVVRIINDVSAAHDVAALTIAEPMPRTAINIRNMLNGIKLFEE
ncbi:MAG: arginase family protein [Kiritimatiellae bacterium]|nr:arginase family protein [Kiritimatiellia bacterium]MBR0198302.1 arginase family protein [Kiritimatiellia bacterium]